MTFPDITAGLSVSMPKLRGRLESNVCMADLCWFRTGGAAQILFTPADEEDLAYCLERLAPDVAVTVVGVGSNLLVRDGGIQGVVIRLGKGFHTLRVEGLRIEAGARILDVKLATAAAEAGIAGLAFYRGIPGAVGGALRMNAGAYGAETKDVLISCRAIDRQGRSHVFRNADMGFTYRHSGVPHDLIFTSALFEGSAGNRAEIEAQMAEITKSREETQPIHTRTGGSTFKNPEGRKAWELIDAAGCRGLVRGDAQVSELHCNFLVNRGKATSADLEDLGEEVRRRVYEKSGVRLEWEIERIGKK